jgi:alanine-glyoxylate transaminase/serine-glyoxylate transaminase/serine-pyruvate transaminase
VRALLAAHKVGSFPAPPPAPVLQGLRAARDRLAAETLPAVFARRRRLNAGVRAGVAAWGLRTVAAHPGLASVTVTAIRPPEAVDTRAANARARITLGSGVAEADAIAAKTATAA